ncbi:MAG: polymerase I protein [candidate division TM6 bacterium GW2011_GWF2_32_72]|nr:MAG: polymerase I protein [candidate division TM6 bacterium GW2011_GWF2_32_72]
MNFDSKKTVFLIDGSSFLYRAYYGMRPIHTTSGKPVQAVYSFCRMIKKLAQKFDPMYMALVWDSKGKTTRHEVFPEYKATRQAPPSDLFEQKEKIVEFANLIGLKQVAKQGIEADDLMFSIAKDLSKEGLNVVLITSDKDMGQALTSEKIYLYDSFKDLILDKKSFTEKIGFDVTKLPFYFALLGDTSDNIPGVHGIGQKGALELVTQFDSLEDLYENLDEVSKPRTRKALEDNEKNAFLSRDLFLLQYLNLEISKTLLKFDFGSWSSARPLFEELEFKSLLADMKPEVSDQELQDFGQASIFAAEKKTEAMASKYNFICVTTKIGLDDLCNKISQAKEVAIDTETTGVMPLQDKFVGISLCMEEGCSYYIPVGHETADFQLSKDVVFAELKKVFEKYSIKKIFHHAKFDKEVLKNAGWDIGEFHFDTLIAAKLIVKDWQRVGLKYLSEFYFNEPMLNFEDVVKDNKYKDFSYVPLDLATQYAAADAHQTFRLKKILEKKLKEEGVEKLYYECEHPIVDVLCNMEMAGIFVAKDELENLGKKVDHDLSKLKKEILGLIGSSNQDINLNSPKQIEDLLFNQLGLPVQKKSGKKTGYSTDQEVLEVLAKLHPVPGLILSYRELYKLKSTYIEALPEFINPFTKKIHTNYNQVAVATGRLSSTSPNLQNVPADGGYGSEIREAFKAGVGDVFISADYSQIELRVLAYLSQDKRLLSAFEKGLDIHAMTAAGLFDEKFEDVTHAQRQVGKRINFSILYGLTPYGLSKDLKISLSDAKEFIEKYFAQYPGVSEWMEKTIEETKKHGYVKTWLGRKRDIPGIYENNKNLYELAKRIAINTRAQGSAAEVMKIGMINLEKKFAEINLGAKIILQIHDELVISVPKKYVEDVQKITQDILQNVTDWNVPLEVCLRSGKTWKDISK